MATKKSQTKANKEARKIEREVEREAGSFINPIDVDQKGPYTPGPTGQPAEGTVSVMADRHPELFQPVVETVEEDPNGKYGTFNYRMSYLWSQPTASSRVVKILNQDDRLELLGESEAGWIKVRSITQPQLVGYVKTVFVKGD